MAERDEEEAVPQLGRAEKLASTSDDEDTWSYAGVLWVPDPQNRGGWGQYFVSKPKPPQASRVTGFRRNK